MYLVSNLVEHGLLQDGPRVKQLLRMLGGGARAKVAVRVGLSHRRLEGVVDLGLGGGQCLRIVVQCGVVRC